MVHADLTDLQMADRVAVRLAPMHRAVRQERRCPMHPVVLRVTATLRVAPAVLLEVDEPQELLAEQLPRTDLTGPTIQQGPMDLQARPVRVARMDRRAHLVHVALAIQPVHMALLCLMVRTAQLATRIVDLRLYEIAPVELLDRGRHVPTPTLLSGPRCDGKMSGVRTC